MVREVDQPDENGQLINEIALLDNFLDLDLVCFLCIELHWVCIEELFYLLEDFSFLL